MMATGCNSEDVSVNFRRAIDRLLSVLSLGALVALSSIGAAIAGTVQPEPLGLGYLQQIFRQQSILDRTQGAGINLTILPTRTIRGPTTNIGVAELDQLVQMSGLDYSLTIPIFYVDSYQSNSVRGLGYFGNNGVTVLTSYQETLQVHPEMRDYETCTADFGYTCYYVIPEVTPSDIPLGWLASATVLAHEIGHNLGLPHANSGLMYPLVPPYHDIDPSDYALTDAQVSTVLASPLVSTFGGLRQIVIAPFSVAAIPEPSTWALMIGGMALVGVTLRRRSSDRRLGHALGPAMGPAPEPGTARPL